MTVAGAKRFLSLWGPVALWCGMIFYLSSIPDLGTGWGLPDLVLRKAAHAVEYAVLAALAWRALAGGGALPPRRLFWVSLVFSGLYAASDEWHQGFVPGRTPSALDVFIDGTGALAACVLLRRRAGKGRP